MLSTLSTFQSLIDYAGGSYAPVIVTYPRNQIGDFKFVSGNYSGSNGNVTLTNLKPRGDGQDNGFYNGNLTDLNLNFGTQNFGIDLKTPRFMNVPNLTYNTGVGCTICFKARLTKSLSYTAEFIGKNNTVSCFGNGNFYCSINTSNASMTLWIGSAGGNRSVTIAPVNGAWTYIVIMFGVNINNATYTLDNSTCSILSDWTSAGGKSFNNFQNTGNQINRTGLTLNNNTTMTLNNQSFASPPTSANTSGTSLFAISDIKLFNKALTWTELQIVYNEG